MKHRQLVIESLESRTVLSTLGVEPPWVLPTQQGETDVAFELELTDATGQACSSLQTGDRFYVNIFVEDQRADAKGVFGAALDLQYDSSLVVLDGPITFGSQFPNAPHASWQQPGVLDELAALGGLTPPGPGRILFAQVQFTAIAPGSVAFTTNAADMSPTYEVLVHGWDDAVALDCIAYGSVAINIWGPSVATTVVPDEVTLPRAAVLDAPEPVEVPEQDSEHLVPGSDVVGNDPSAPISPPWEDVPTDAIPVSRWDDPTTQEDIDDQWPAIDLWYGSVTKEAATAEITGRDWAFYFLTELTQIPVYGSMDILLYSAQMNGNTSAPDSTPLDDIGQGFVHGMLGTPLPCPSNSAITLVPPARPASTLSVTSGESAAVGELWFGMQDSVLRSNRSGTGLEQLSTKTPTGGDHAADLSDVPSMLDEIVELLAGDVTRPLAD